MALLRAREAAEYLSVSLTTLYRIEREGRLMPFRTPGGHRRYSLAMLNEYLNRSRGRPLSASLSIEHAKNVQGEKLSDGTVRILVVDDEPDTVELIVRALREDSEVYEFASASNGYEAGVQVMAFKPDLIVLSIAGPETDEFEVCKKIKSDPETEHIKVVGVVGPGENGTIGEMLRYGADDSLIEPLQIEELQRSVRYLTSRKTVVEDERRVISVIDGMGEGGLVLVVDDDRANCEFFKDTLETRGYQVTIAWSGEEAIEIVRENSYDMIFIDMKLPSMSGLETYLAIKKASPQAVAVMMTAYSQEADDLLEEPLGADIHTYLYKPFEIEEVIQLVDGICHRNRQ